VSLFWTLSIPLDSKNIIKKKPKDIPCTGSVEGPSNTTIVILNI
jgi:hypothetical protein